MRSESHGKVTDLASRTLQGQPGRFSRLWVFQREKKKSTHLRAGSGGCTRARVRCDDERRRLIAGLGGERKQMWGEVT